jgi:transposase InsO family protein
MLSNRDNPVFSSGTGVCMDTPSPCSVPRNWTRSIRAALLNVISLAQYALVYTRSWAGNSRSQRVRLVATVNQLQQEVALLREELRIKDARMARIPPGRRPHYQPVERLAILELRAARGWSLAQTSTVFQVTTNTIASWGKRLDEDGPEALVQPCKPVNKFPDFVRYIVQRLQTLCPRLGKVKIAQVLARAGLHLATTTVGRLRRQAPTPPAPPAETMPSTSRVTAKRPNHVWHVDFTMVPTSAGHWAAWLPFALPQCWPFCWWLAVVVDHFSRRALGCTLLTRQPTSKGVCQFLGTVIARVGAAPKHLVTDSGTQYTCAGFRKWCRRRGIRHRRGAVGRSGSIAVVERFIRTLKDGCTRVLHVVPLIRRTFRRELQFFLLWYNRERPHDTLQGATPDEIYFARRPACLAPRFELRAAWPRSSQCAKPKVLVKGKRGVRLEMRVDFLADRRHLPIVNLKRVA